MDIPSTLGGHKEQFDTHRVKARNELTELFANKAFSSASRLQVSGSSFRLVPSCLTLADRGGAHAKGRCSVFSEEDYRGSKESSTEMIELMLWETDRLGRE